MRTRVLRPALVKAGIAVKVGEVELRKRNGTVKREPVWEYQGSDPGDFGVSAGLPDKEEVPGSSPGSPTEKTGWNPFGSRPVVPSAGGRAGSADPRRRHS